MRNPPPPIRLLLPHILILPKRRRRLPLKLSPPKMRRRIVRHRERRIVGQHIDQLRPEGVLRSHGLQTSFQCRLDG